MFTADTTASNLPTTSEPRAHKHTNPWWDKVNAMQDAQTESIAKEEYDNREQSDDDRDCRNNRPYEDMFELPT